MALQGSLLFALNYLFFYLAELDLTSGWLLWFFPLSSS